MPRPSSSITITDALRALELEPGAPWEEVRQSYLDLVRVWHPDRFESDPRLRARAAKRLTAVNEAYRILEDGHAIPTPRIAHPAAPDITGDRRPTRVGAFLAAAAVIVIVALPMMPRSGVPVPTRVFAPVLVAPRIAAPRAVAPQPFPRTVSAPPVAPPPAAVHPKSFIARETDEVLARSRR